MPDSVMSGDCGELKPGAGVVRELVGVDVLLRAAGLPAGVGPLDRLMLGIVLMGGGGSEPFSTVSRTLLAFASWDTW